MTPIGEYESDDQGYVHLNKTLEDGKYYVREIVAAEGYILDNKVKSFTVLAGDTAMIEWENTPNWVRFRSSDLLRAIVPSMEYPARHSPLRRYLRCL